MTAKVYEARDSVSGQKAALKVMRTDGQNDYRHFFDNEVMALQRLSHNNIPSLIEHNTKSGTRSKDVKIALEYIEGVELIDFLMAKGHLKESIARHIFRKLVVTLKHMHSRGVVHRDIKSDNIMLKESCEPVIVDFGFAADANGEDDSGYFFKRIGTDAYMAPELHMKAPYKGAQVDIFALGIVLFQMIFGRPPFMQADDNDVLYRCIINNRSDLFWRKHIQHMADDIVISESFKDLMTSMFQLSPENRLSLDQILAHDWV